MAARRGGLLAGLVGALLIPACAPPPQPKQLPPQAVTQQAPDPPPPSDPAPSAPPKSDSVIVVDKGGDKQDEQPSLAQAGRAEKERRQAMAKPAVVINDKNLAEHAAKGQITTAKPAERDAQPAPSEPTTRDGRNEAYWRTRGLEIRQSWHDSAEQVHEQQKSVERLRTAFYAEDDPYVRDGRIKPEWDRALEKLDQARRGVDQAKKDIEKFMEEGREAGAYEAWLEEGVDLEPAQETPKPKPSEPGEPKVIEPGNQEPPFPA